MQRKIKNLKQECQSLTIVIHGDTNLVGVGPQTTLVYVWVGRFCDFWKKSIISLKWHKIGIQLLWRTYRKS